MFIVTDITKTRVLDPNESWNDDANEAYLFDNFQLACNYAKKNQGQVVRVPSTYATCIL